MIKEELLHSVSSEKVENTSKLNRMEVLKRISEDLNKRKTELEKEKSDEEKKLGEVVRNIEIIITNLELFLQILNSHSILRGLEIGATLNSNSILENLAILPIQVPDLSKEKNESFYIRMKEEYNSKVKEQNKISNAIALMSAVGIVFTPNLLVVGVSAIITAISRRFVDNRIKEAIPKLQSITTEELELKRQELNSINNTFTSKQEEIDELELRIKSVDEKIKKIEIEQEKEMKVISISKQYEYLQLFQEVNEKRVLENELWRKNIDCIEEPKVKSYEIRNKSWKSLKQ